MHGTGHPAPSSGIYSTQTAGNPCLCTRQSVNILAHKLAIHPNTLRHYITTYYQGGLEALCQPEQRKQPQRLTAQQEADFKQILLKDRPADHGLNGNSWTGYLMCQFLKGTYQVDYHLGIKRTAANV